MRSDQRAKQMTKQCKIRKERPLGPRKRSLTVMIDQPVDID